MISSRSLARYGTEPEATVKAVEWLGVQNQLRSLLKSGAEGKRVTLISSMGATTPPKSGSNKAQSTRL